MDSFFLVLFIIFIGWIGRRRVKRLERRLAELRGKLDGVLAEIASIKGETPASAPGETREPMAATMPSAAAPAPPAPLDPGEAPEKPRPQEPPRDMIAKPMADVLMAETAPVLAAPVESASQDSLTLPPAIPALPPETAPPKPRDGRSFEERLGAHWTVWIGGIALALGAVLLVRYSIESGFFGPRMRIALGALLSVALVAAGEFLRRRDVAGEMPSDGKAREGDQASASPFATPYIPGVLTAAGTVAAFATIYAAHAVYGFIGPALTFVGLGLVGLATMAAAALHGRALAGLGLVGALMAPLLVVSEAPSPWPVIAYDLAVVAAAYALARIKGWRWLALAAATGAALWALPFIGLIEGASGDEYLRAALTHIGLQLALAAYALAVGLHRGRPDLDADIDLVPHLVLGLFALLAILALAVASPAHFGESWIFGTVAVAAILVATGVLAAPACGAVAMGGLVAIAALCLWPGPPGDLASRAGGMLGQGARAMAEAPLWLARLMDGVPPSTPLSFAAIAIGLPLLVALAGLWRLLRGADLPLRVASPYAGAAALPPLASLAIAYLRFASHRASPQFALIAVTLGLAYAFVGFLFRRSALADDSAGIRLGLGAMAASAIAGFSLGLVFGLDRGMLTVGLALSALGTAYVARRLDLAVLRWCVAVLGVLVAARLAYEPRIVGSGLSKTPVFNWLLFGYGVPALSFALAGRLLRQARDDIPVHVADALAILFSALLFFFEIRHALNGGDPFAPASGLVEQGLLAVTSLGFSLVLTRLDAGRRNIVFRYASIIAGGLGMVIAAIGLGIGHNPFLRPTPVEGGPVLNALWLGYLIPAVMAAALALGTRKLRPFWYWGAAGWLAFLLGLAFLMLETRVLFHGPVIAAELGAGIIELGIDTVICLGVAALLIRRAGGPVPRCADTVSDAAPAHRLLVHTAFVAGALGFCIAAIGLGLIHNPFLDPTPLPGGLVLNALIPGYLLPALAATGLAASTRKAHATWYWAGIAGLGVALGFAYLLFEVRVLFHGQVIVAALGAGIAELGVDTAICLGVAILSSVRIGGELPGWRQEASIAVAAIGGLIFVIGLSILANPLFGETKVTGSPSVNTLLVGYALPCLMAAILARRAREAAWARYAGFAGIGAILALFAYASLEIRFLFQGTAMDIRQGFQQGELYAYSAAWLALGILLLAYGLWRGSREARLGSACFVVAAVVKVFLIDLAGLEGILRALSFIGLGAVLIGIGLVYQKFVFGRRSPSAEGG